MKQLEGQTTPSTQHTELVCQQIDLPGRFPIFTDGQMHDLDKNAKLQNALSSQDAMDSSTERAIKAMVERVVKAARKKLKEDGLNPLDWKYTVMIAVHHKGQATDFWFGDGPEKEVKVDQNLPENLRKPVEAQRLKIEKR